MHVVFDYDKNALILVESNEEETITEILPIPLDELNAEVVVQSSGDILIRMTFAAEGVTVGNSRPEPTVEAVDDEPEMRLSPEQSFDLAYERILRKGPHGR